MRLKMKIALLLCLIGAAMFTGAEAVRSLRQPADRQFPAEIYSRFARNADSAAFFLRRDGAYVAVYPGRRARDPVEVTRIEIGRAHV